METRLLKSNDRAEPALGDRSLAAPPWHARMRRLFGAALRAIVPEGVRALRGDWVRARVEVATAKLIRLAGDQVRSGQFAGMRYIRASHCSQLGPKLLGTYERELEAVVEHVLEHGFGRLIDVGAAEGYYACGLLWRSPSLEAVAFEMSEKARDSLRTLADLNGVSDRLRVEATCTPTALNAELGSPEDVFLLMDVEGCERELLDPVAIPNLGRVHILVELHDFLVPQIGSLVHARFESTHRILRISSKRRRLLTMPRIEGLTRSEVLAAAREARPARQEWFWMQPRTPATRFRNHPGGAREERSAGMV